MGTFQTSEIGRYDMLDASGFQAALISGLAEEPKSAPFQYLYDRQGVELFDLERRQPEYYLANVEEEIYGYFGAEIAASLGAGSLLIDAGLGSRSYVHSILPHLERPAGYVAVDLSPETSRASVEALAERYPGLPLTCLAADFTTLASLPEAMEGIGESRTIFLPGGLIGNLGPDQVRAALGHYLKLIGPNGKILAAVDLPKPKVIVEKAYRDKAQIADRLHLNLLRRANQEAAANFDLLKFRYEARYNEDDARVEMGVVSMASQEVVVGGRKFVLANNEKIRTQWAYKFTAEQFQDLAHDAGLRPTQLWLDSRQYFSVHLLEP